MKLKMNKRIGAILMATSVAIFSLVACFTGVYAWFSSNRVVTVSGASFKVLVPDQLEYELYYLSSFTDDESNTKPGNYNSTTGYFSGYQLDYEDATFTKVNYTDGVVTDVPNPTEINHLWPAHKLTFAFVITQASMSKLSITDWGEGEGSEAIDAAKISASQYVRLSWAIDIYGAAYNVAETGNTLTDIHNGYEDYFADTKTDVFDYAEDNLANVPPTPKDEIDVVTSIPENGANERTIVYFTIEFSNDNSTFYKYNDTTTYYERYSTGDITGYNSNCYEGLSLTSLVFSIV